MKVAGYCRVSTDKEDQNNSFLSQQQFFKDYIRRQHGWELYEIYADEGITGTSTKKRFEFNRMIDDARSGRFDLILTKEVSRFSRNILDTIAYTRELKSLGIGVMFLTDGIHTLDPDAELRLSIMASIAQEESRKTSCRVKWGQTRQMERGVVFGRSMLGYHVREGKMSIEPKGAEIVRQIFHKYGIEKKGTTVIARELQEEGFRTMSGNTVWTGSGIVKILRNEKYAGDLIQKKTCTPDYLTHEKKYNHGLEEKIILKDHHEPIIPRDLWDLTQAELNRRNRRNGCLSKHSVRYPFSGRIHCGECGANFIARQKKRKDGTTYRTWGCANAAAYGRKHENTDGTERGCSVGLMLREELIRSIILQSVASLSLDVYKISQLLSERIRMAGQSAQCSDIGTMTKQIESLKKRKSAAIDAYLSSVINESELSERRAFYDAQISALQDRLAKAENDRSKCNLGHLRLRLEGDISDILSGRVENDSFYREILDEITVFQNGSIEVRLKSLPQTFHFLIEG